MGRPPVAKPKTPRVYVRLEAEDLKALRHRCVELGTTPGELARDLILAELAKPLPLAPSKP